MIADAISKRAEAELKPSGTKGARRYCGAAGESAALQSRSEAAVTASASTARGSVNGLRY